MSCNKEVGVMEYQGEGFIVYCGNKLRDWSTGEIKEFLCEECQKEQEK